MRETKGLAKHFREANSAGVKKMRVKRGGGNPAVRLVPAGNSRVVFVFKCVDCQTKNETKIPPKDMMLDCSRCGWPTVQTLHEVISTLS